MNNLPEMPIPPRPLTADIRPKGFNINDVRFFVMGTFERDAHVTMFSGFALNEHELFTSAWIMFRHGAYFVRVSELGKTDVTFECMSDFLNYMKENYDFKI